MAKISVVINTLNEEKNLPRVLASVKSLADEVVVCDMQSDDGTVEVAKGFGAKTFSHKRAGYVEPARNFAISKATGDWILILDADEEVGVDLVSAIKRVAAKPKADYYRIARKNIIFGKWLKHSRWWPDYNIRFFKKGHVSWSEVIHKVPTTVGRGENLPDRENMAIVHHNYGTVEQYLERMNKYTTAHAAIKVTEGYRFTWRDLINKPSAEFLSRYFFGRGYKDGLHGLAVSMLQAFSELVLYLKIWQAEKFKAESLGVGHVIKEMKKQEKEIHYWQNDALYKETGNLGARVKRKLRI